MNRQTRTLVILGVIVLGVALVIWTFAAREQARQTALSADSSLVMDNAPAAHAGGLDAPETRNADGRSVSTSLCDDLTLTDEIGTRPVEERRTKAVAIYEGDPERHRRVDRMVGGDSTFWVWKLPETREGYWIECRYEGGEVRSQRLPDNVSECTVALQKSAETPVIRGVACS
jgi:hypothetical protein